MRVDVPFEKWILGTDVLQRRKTVKRALSVLEKHRLANHEYVASDELSIADILCYEEVVQIEVWNLLGSGGNLGFDGDGTAFVRRQYPNIHRWLMKMRKLTKHDEIHAIMISDFILNHVKKRQIAFAKELKRLKPKL